MFVIQSTRYLMSFRPRLPSRAPSFVLEFVERKTGNPALGRPATYYLVDKNAGSRIALQPFSCEDCYKRSPKYVDVHYDSDNGMFENVCISISQCHNEIWNYEEQKIPETQRINFAERSEGSWCNKISTCFTVHDISSNSATIINSIIILKISFVIIVMIFDTIYSSTVYCH